MKLYISKGKGEKVYHHGQVWGTKDLKGDKALVGKYKTKGGEMKHPPKGKKAKKKMASDLIREHMHHLGRHSGGPDQAIAIALKQAGMSRKKSLEGEEGQQAQQHLQMANRHNDFVRQHVGTGHTDLVMRNLKALAAHIRAAKVVGTDEFDHASARAHHLSSQIEQLSTQKALPEATSEAAPEPKAVPVTTGYKPSKQAAGVQEAHQRATEALGRLQALHQHLSGMAEKWKAEDEETGKRRASLLRRSLDELVAKGHRGFYSTKRDPDKRGGADTPKAVVDAVGGKGHAGFYRKRTPKKIKKAGEVMDKTIDVNAEQERAEARAAQKALPLMAAAGAAKMIGGAASSLGNAASTLAGSGSQSSGGGQPSSGGSSPSPASAAPSAEKSVGSACKGCGKSAGMCKCVGKSKTAQAIDILKARMKLVTDESGKMTPVSTEHTPTMSLERQEGGQHRMVSPSSFGGGKTGSGRMQTSGGEHTEVIASTPRMHTPGAGNLKVADPAKPQYTPGQLHTSPTEGPSKPDQVWASSAPVAAPKIAKPKTETESALGELKQMGPSKTFGSTPKPPTESESALHELKQMRAQKALKSLLNKAPTEMSSNPQHGEPARYPRGEKPEVHHALGAAFHERRRDAMPVGTSEWERHDTLASGHKKDLIRVAGSPKAASAAIKQAHSVLTNTGSSAIKDRHVSPGGGGTRTIPEHLLQEREPAWTGPKQSASSVRGKLMASVEGKMDKALVALLSKGRDSCPDCGKPLSKPNLKRCPHCNTELPKKITSRLNPRWGFRAAGVEKSEPEAKSAAQDAVSDLSKFNRERFEKEGDEPIRAPKSKPKAEYTHAAPGQRILGKLIEHQRSQGMDKSLRIKAPKGKKIEKAMSAASVPRMPRALAARMDSWRNATNVMTRANSRFSDGINTAVLLPDPTEVTPEQMASNPTVCKGCGRSYMHKSFPEGCPTCSTRREVPGAWDFVSKATMNPGNRCDHCGKRPVASKYDSGKLITVGKHQYCEGCHDRLSQPKKYLRAELQHEEHMKMLDRDPSYYGRVDHR
jgi:rubrerythrin